MPVVAYSCSFVPCELIAAHGCTPRRVLPAGAEQAKGLREGVCPFVASLTQTLAHDDAIDAVILTTVCDQMRRGADLLRMDCGRPVFVMHVPATWQTDDAQRLYLDELGRLGGFLQMLSDIQPSQQQLTEIVESFDAARRELLSRAPSLSAREFVQAVAEFPDPQLSAGSPPPESAIPIGLVGGELIAEDIAILDRLESAGARIALNATDFGERGLPAPPDGQRLGDDPMAELARMYFHALPHAFRRPNTAFLSYLQQMLRERQCRGLVCRRTPRCDTCNAETHHLRELTALPVLELDFCGEGDSDSRTTGRIEAFLEAIA